MLRFWENTHSGIGTRTHVKTVGVAASAGSLREVFTAQVEPRSLVTAIRNELRQVDHSLPITLRLEKQYPEINANLGLEWTSAMCFGRMEHRSRMAANKLGTLRLSTECYTCYYWLPVS